MDATGVIGREVRELVRPRGLDPGEVTAAVRKLLDEEIADYDDLLHVPALGQQPMACRR